MSSYLRPRIPGATVFFTVTLQQRGSDLLTRKIDALQAAIAMTRAERPFHMDAWVVMPDHLHMVWTLPEGDADYSTRWSVIKARFSRSVPAGPRRRSQIERRERGIWQRRYWEHHVRDEIERAAFITYCHFNPVKHGFAACPEDWPYSSIHGYA
jgi:putative transposase